MGETICNPFVLMRAALNFRKPNLRNKSIRGAVTHNKEQPDFFRQAHRYDVSLHRAVSEAPLRQVCDRIGHRTALKTHESLMKQHNEHNAINKYRSCIWYKQDPQKVLHDNSYLNKSKECAVPIANSGQMTAQVRKLRWLLNKEHDVCSPADKNHVMNNIKHSLAQSKKLVLQKHKRDEMPSDTKGKLKVKIGQPKNVATRYHEESAAKMRKKQYRKLGESALAVLIKGNGNAQSRRKGSAS